MAASTPLVAIPTATPAIYVLPVANAATITKMTATRLVAHYMYSPVNRPHA